MKLISFVKDCSDDWCITQFRFIVHSIFGVICFIAVTVCGGYFDSEYSTEGLTLALPLIFIFFFVSADEFRNNYLNKRLTEERKSHEKELKRTSDELTERIWKEAEDYRRLEKDNSELRREIARLKSSLAEAQTKKDRD